jgi:uncharacterized membrane protein YgdD (TMEM256/DUF423 family)
MRLMIILGSINMALAIALGAFGAHGLEGKVSEKMMQIWNTGAHYHIIHGLALIAVGLMLAKTDGNATLLTVAGWLLFAGIVFFSGSLYALVLTNVKILGAITPIGGVSFIVGWVLVAISAAKYLA